MFSEDRSLFFRDFGVPATFNGETASVLFDAPEQVVMGRDVISAEYEITYPVGTFKSLEYGSSIVVDGISYSVDTVQAIDDGKIIKATLSRT